MRETILTLHAEGKSYNEIVAIVGCSKSTVSYHCGKGQADKSLRRQRDRRSVVRKHIQMTKELTPCMDCGVNYPYYVMDFDHRPGEVKSFTIAYVAKDMTLDKVKEEISKCDIVCANCHRIRSWDRKLVNGDSAL